MEGAVGYDRLPSPTQDYENIYETIHNDPSGSNEAPENIYERVEDMQNARFAPHRIASDRNVADEPNNGNMQDQQPSCSSTYGRIGNAYGRIDIIGHGIGRIERHLSSSCGSGIDNNHYTIENFYGQNPDMPGRISKVSVQWLLVNKWLPMWIANTGNGRDYRIIDFLLGHRGDYDNIPDNKQNDENEPPDS